MPGVLAGTDGTLPLLWDKGNGQKYPCALLPTLGASGRISRSLSECSRTARASLPGQRSEPFYNRDPNLTRALGLIWL